MPDTARGGTRLTKIGLGGAITALVAVVSAVEYPVLLVAAGNVLAAALGLAVALLGLGSALFAAVFDTLLLLAALCGLLVLALHRR